MPQHIGQERKQIWHVVISIHFLIFLLCSSRYAFWKEPNGSFKCLVSEYVRGMSANIVPTTTRQRTCVGLYSCETRQIERKTFWLLCMLTFSATCHVAPEWLQIICIYFVHCSTSWLKNADITLRK